MVNDYKVGEELAIKCLRARGFQIIDQRNNPDYWKRDIDIVAIKDGVKNNIEIKWDSRIGISNAYFFELYTDIDKDKLGWANYTEADYIFYGDSRSKYFYVFKRPDMRRYLEEHKGEYETRIASDYKRDGTVRKRALGAIVPVGKFEQVVGVQKIDIEQRLNNAGF